MTGSRPSRVASMVLGLTLLTTGVSCNSSTISGMGTGGTSGGRPGAGCAAACSTSDAVCGALGCDDAGACVYPSAGTACPGTSCSGSMLSQRACDGAGACEPLKIGTACPGSYACGIDGSCGTSCNSTAYCASGFVCNTGTCIKPIEEGSCSENDDCTSAICGVAGAGNCCSKACTTGDATCGSTGCDDGGACVYPDQSVVCGSTDQSCTGSTQTNVSTCNGLGHCDGGTTDCSPFVCGITACTTTCALDSDCGDGSFCDVLTASCCAGLVDGGTLAVDSVLGDDAVACCGRGGARSCRTLTRAMSLVEADPVGDTVLEATVNGVASGDWKPEGEVYPIGLGWGVELRAPGVFFQGGLVDAGGSLRAASAIFEEPADAGGAESASIVGMPSNPVWIGTDPQGDQLVSDSAIEVGQGSTLYLANASANGSLGYDSYAIHASGGLILGQDRRGAVSGTVRIGNASANPNTDGNIGIGCYGCTLNDVPMHGASSVVITGQRMYDIDAEGAASVSLKSAPILGIPPASVGFNTCPSKVDLVGMNVDGPVTVSLDHATIQCISRLGIWADESGVETPSLTINDTTIQNTQLALYVAAGSAVVSNSTIRYNNSGVWLEAGTVDLSGGDAGGRNTVACSNSISVLNETSATLNASNVDWDTAEPDLFSCDSNLSNCACLIASCTDAPGADGMDAVVTVDGGAILTTGNRLSPLDCTVPPGPDAGP